MPAITSTLARLQCGQAKLSTSMPNSSLQSRHRPRGATISRVSFAWAAHVPAATASNAFAVDLYAQLAKEEGNIFFSPASVSTALSLAWAGANGETRSEMSAAMHLNELGDTPLLVAADLQRPNAVNQLQVVGEQAGVPVFRSADQESRSGSRLPK